MNVKRLDFSLIFGTVMGVLCVFGNLPNIPVDSPNSGFLFIAFWNRFLMGFTIAWLGDLKIYQDAKSPFNALIRGAIIGALFSFHLAFFSSIFSYMYFLAGIGFGAGIDLLASIIAKEK
jgi:hypothetical protein